MVEALTARFDWCQGDFHQLTAIEQAGATVRTIGTGEQACFLADAPLLCIVVGGGAPVCVYCFWTLLDSPYIGRLLEQRVAAVERENAIDAAHQIIRRGAA